MRGVVVSLSLTACSFHGQAVSDAQPNAIDAAVDASLVDSQSCAGPCFRRKLTIPAANIGNLTLKDFPLLVALDNDGELRDHARADGFDLSFVDDVGTPLTYEREVFSKSNGQLRAWVKIPALGTGVDAVIYLRYGDAQQGVDQQNRAGTWAANYKGVWHLDETSGSLHDSTANANHGSAANGLTFNAPGAIGAGIAFAQPGGTATAFPQLRVPASATLSSVAPQATISAWVKFTQPLAGHYQTLVTNNINSNGISWASDAGGSHYFYPWTGDANDFDRGSNPFTAGVWHYVAVTYDFTVASPDAKIFVDGTAMPITTRNIPTLWTQTATLGDWLWGWNPDFINQPANFTGSMDEIRVQFSARSMQFLKAESLNQHLPTTFYVLGAPEAL